MTNEGTVSILEQPGSQIALPATRQPATVLVADDSEHFRSLWADLLAANGFRPVCAGNGMEALAILKDESIDLALLDVQMPELDGYSVCRSLKQNPNTRLIPVVLITGLNSIDDRVEGIESGADDYLSKPVQNAEFLAKVRSLIDRKHFTDQLERAEKVVISLVRCLEAKNAYTAGHSERVAVNATALAKRVGLSRDQCELVRRGAVVHDVGKVAVPDHILQKPGRLTAEETKLMEQHPEFGKRICAPLDSFRPLLPIIRSHHERLDGTGYPDGLKGDQIPLTTRIVSIADVFDALTSDRPYRRPLTLEEAFEQMRVEVAKGWWDASLFAEFQALLASTAADNGTTSSPLPCSAS